jgi:type I restriction enzyme S subunit
MSAIIDGHFNGLKANCRIGELIYVISQRNRRQESLPVLSVSNRSGFIAQSEQFGNRTIASEDTSNYKIVITNDFAFNPARINVGSIARLINYKRGIVSPMYICFRCKEGISSEYLDLFFKSRYFQTEVGKRLEGSVRQCLSIDGIKSIPIERIPMSQQIKWTKRLTTIETKITIEENIYQLYKLQRNYLLSKMFI